MQHSSLLCCVRISILLGSCSAMGIAQETPQSAPVPPPQASSTAAPDFSQARKLMQQGKLDEAIAELQALEASDPSTKGLDLELGTAYYKKNEYVKKNNFFKKKTQQSSHQHRSAS